MTAEATGRAPAGEAGFRLLAEQRLRASQRQLPEALGGRFWVTTAPGEGTVVEARLPLTDPSEGLRL